MPNLTAGPFEIRVQAPGYFERELEVVVTTSILTIDFQLTPRPSTFTVSGRATSEANGAAVPFLDVEIIQGANIGRRFQGDNNGQLLDA
jgi:hypothetical protein